jgi:myosin heavy subunit
MLEQAVIDAKMLREAAVKNAEETLIEKYSDDIKDAVEKLLEQDEEEVGDVGIDAPLAATDGEDLCACPDEEDEIELNLSDIKSELEKIETGDSSEELGSPEPHEVAAAAALEEDLDREVNEEGKEDLEEDFELDLTEEELEDLLEKVVVDMESSSGGWPGRPRKEADFEVEKDLARLAHEEDLDEDEDKLKKENKELEDKMNKLQEAVKTYQEREEQYKDVVSSLKEKFDELALSNTRLLYTNKILSSTSLNERQKQKIVDAISNISSAEEAKVIFETLESAVGSMSKRRGPKSLSEAVEKRTSSLLAGRRKEPQSDMPDSTRTRLQRLAGINNK